MTWTPLPEVTEITLDTPQPKKVVLDPAKTAVVVVDMQKTQLKRPRPVDVIPGNEVLLAKAREAGAKVLYVQSLRQAESPDHVFYKGPRQLQPGTWDVEIMDEIAPMDGETVVKKYSNDVWSWHGMEEALEKEGIVSGEWNVLVTGVSAAACAEACSLGFANRLYNVIIPLDCTAASIEAEARTWALYSEPEYSANMSFTVSNMVGFEATPEIMEPIAIPTA